MPSIWNKVISRNKTAERVWTFFEEPDSSLAASIYRQAMFVIVLIGVVLPLLQTIPSKPFSHLVFFWMSTGLDVMMVTETLIRWAVSPNFMHFLLSFFNLLDLSMVGPLVIRCAFLYSPHDGEDGRTQVTEAIMLCVVPVMRAFRALRNLRNFTLLFHTLDAVLEPLTVPLSMLLLISLISSSALYLMEPRDNINSMPHAMYLVFVTLSTVGYGDVYPTTDGGRAVVSVLILFGMLCMAMPISIVGTAFTETWKNRTRILTIGRIRGRMVQWGYTEEDLRALFKRFDEDRSGELDADEFSKMVSTMRLGLDQSATERLFNVFDADGSGALDVDEFVEGIGLNGQGRMSSVF